MNTNPENTPGQTAPAPGKLAELLVKHDLVTLRQIEEARAQEDPARPDLVKTLVSLGFIKEQAVTSILVKQLKLPRLNLQDYQIDAATLKVLPRELCLRYRILPIDVLGRNLTLAMVNPLDDAALAAVQQVCPEYRLKAFVCSLSEFELAARRVFPSEEANAASDEMSLASLGIQSKPRPKAAPAPAPPPPPEKVVDEDATATVLFGDEHTAASRPAGPLRSCLICLDGWELGREIEISPGDHTLGRSPDADTRVNSPLISREHARLTRSEEQGQESVVITDLNSSNGTFVNNIRVTTTILRHGDRVMLGNVLFKFVLLDEIEARFHQDVHRLYSMQKGTALLPAEDWVRELERILGNPGQPPQCACLIEIDNLQEIAQRRGHIASVIVMSDVGDLLERYLEKADLPGDFGDGHIAVTFPGKPVEAVFALLEDLRRTVEAHVFHLKEDRFRTTITIGLATAPPGTNSGDFIESLRGALKHAVAQGRNATVVQQ